MAMTLRLSESEDRALELLAQAEGCSKQEAARRAIASAATRVLRQAEARAIVAQVIDADMALLRKLSR